MRLSFVISHLRACVPLLLLACLVPLLGACTPSFLITPVPDKSELREEKVLDGEGWFQRKVVIIPVDGMIINARGSALLGPSENMLSLITQQLQRAKDDPTVAAVVLRINSPGGTVTASDTIYELIRKWRQETSKPVVASVQEVGASGAYYIAMAADEVVAQPTSVVGSIGVVFTTFDVAGTLEKIGARTYTMKTGQFKDIGSPFKPLTAPERDLIQNMIEQYFGRFRAVVQTNRKLTTDELTKVSDGRAFTGEEALSLKLVDRLGRLEDAIDVARQRAGARGAKAVIYMRPHGYGGSIYATNELPPAEWKSTQIVLPMAEQALPTGFYFLWRPGL